MSHYAVDNYRTLSVPVRGGDLAVGVWGPDDAPAVLAVHGVTATHRSWPAVARHLPGVRFIAPDLRGRGRSNGLPRPWGMPQHADDLAAVLEALNVPRALVLGHSMGAFASLVLANRHPALVSGLVLVDGGLPLASPEGLSDDELTRATLGPAAERLSMVFPSRQHYADFWRRHPAFVDDWNDTVAAYVDYDLTGEEPELRPSTSYEAVAEDSIELRGGVSLMAALDGLAHPTAFLRAPRGLLNEPTPLYSPADVAAWRQRLPGLITVEVPGVNHYTILMTDRGAAAVAAAVTEMFAALGRAGVQA
ncbi:MAG: alpha/beta hydrolase [Microbacteriaceae bacterium]|nr:alpha/beta hydrolase [Microbacteriaceae bacterium]